MTTIAQLNDAFRHAGPNTDWIVTAGIHDQGPEFILTAVRAVMDHTDFGPDSDPWHEHDFGVIWLGLDKLFWKIDCYDRDDMTRGSSDPADPAVTRRVLTIMLAAEY